MLAFLHPDLSKRLADVLLQLLVIVDPLHDQVFGMTANTGENRLEHWVSFVNRTDRRSSQLRPLHLGHALFSRSGRDLAPFGAGVVQVPVLEREGKAGTDGCGLAENGQTLLTIALNPAKAATMNLR